MEKPLPENQKSPWGFDQLELAFVQGKGKAVFSKKAFAKGSLVLEFVGAKRHVSELNDLTYALQIGPSTYLESSGLLDDYVNHSCNPNTGISQDAFGRVLLFALRPIEIGEEITFDYATTQSGGHSSMSCLCGAANCRGTISDFSELPEDLKIHYSRQGAVLEYLLGASAK